MKKTRVFYLALAILIGAFLFVYGGYDDSPGAQLLGLVVAISGVVGVVKSRKKPTTDPDKL